MLWGYFAFMAAESCGGSQMVDRVLLLATDPARRAALLRGPHAPYLETVPFAVTAAFTVLQVRLDVRLHNVVFRGSGQGAPPLHRRPHHVGYMRTRCHVTTLPWSGTAGRQGATMQPFLLGCCAPRARTDTGS